MKVIHSSRSVQRSMSNSPNADNDILVKIERSFARLAEDSGASKKELHFFEPVLCPLLTRRRGILQVEFQVANNSTSKRKKVQVKRQDYMLLNHQMTRDGCQNQLNTSHGQN